jgi:DNA-binding FadR family transcriptional regulator
VAVRTEAAETPSKASIAIAADIRRRIVTGELVAGAPLPVEDALMADLRASRSVVREALRILETEGLLAVRRGVGGGPTVRHPSIQQTANSMGVYLQIGDVLVSDVWEARDRIIGNAVERLAANRTDAEADELATVAGDLTKVIGDLEGYYPQLITVGETVVRLAGNATEYTLVVALRHVIAAELEQATRAIVANQAPITVNRAVAREGEVARAWEETARHVKARRGPAARRSYNRAADPLRLNITKRNRGKVVDIFRVS